MQRIWLALSRAWRWAGERCAFMAAWCGAIAANAGLARMTGVFLLLGMLALVALVWAAGSDDDWFAP